MDRWLATTASRAPVNTGFLFAKNTRGGIMKRPKEFLLGLIAEGQEKVLLV
jgi:hypothetical protein